MRHARAARARATLADNGSVSPMYSSTFQLTNRRFGIGLEAVEYFGFLKMLCHRFPAEKCCVCVTVPYVYSRTRSTAAAQQSSTAV